MMKTMKALCAGLFPLLLGCLLFAACSEEDLVKKDNMLEGLPTSLKFTLTVPQFSEATVTRASDATETELQQLALFFYKQSDTSKPFFVKEIDNFGSGPLTDVGSPTNYFYEIEIPQEEGLTSGNYKLYAIANWDNSFCNIDLDACRDLSLEDLKNNIISRTAQNNALDLIGFTPMSGKFGPKEGDGEISLYPEAEKNVFSRENGELIRLRRAVAKVTFDFKNGEGVTFTPESYSIYNFSLSSTLVDRAGWQGTSGTKPGNLQYSGNDGFRDFEDMKFTDATPNEFTFYMLENVQHARKTEGLTKLLREKRELTDNNQRGDFVYAPERSTYVVVNGYYDGPGTNGIHVSGNVSYTIQLGDFKEERGGVDNFTIRRNVKYNYTVTVKGVNNIITEALAQDADGEVQPGAEGDLVAAGDNAISIPLDAHYEKVLLRIPSGVLKNPLFYVSTPFSRTLKGIQPNAADAAITDDSKDCNWIHFAKPIEDNGNITFGKFNNGNGLANVFDLLKELPNEPKDGNDGDHYIVRGGYVYTTAYVDEYYYTENPNGGSIQLSDFINRPDRVMNICTTKSISVDGSSSYVAETIITFRQNAIYTMYPLTGITNPFGIEKKNEWGAVKRGATTTQDGNLTINNGWENTKLLTGTKEYDLKGVGYTFANGESIPDFNTGNITDDAGTKVSYITAMSRNRDANDNGKIDEDELKWYLPARNQCLALWMGNNDLGEYRPYNANGLESKTKDEVEGPDGLLHTSSGANSAVWWAIEGASFGRQSIGTSGSNESNRELDLRCVRNLNDEHRKEIPTQFSQCDGYVVCVNGLSNNCLRTGMMTGEYSVNHTERMIDNRLPAAFEVANKDLVITTEGTPGDDYVPEVTIGTIFTSTTSSEGWFSVTTVFYRIPLTIDRKDGHHYYRNTSASLTGAEEIRDDQYTWEGELFKHYDDTSIGLGVQSRLYILSENGNYVEIAPSGSVSRRNWTYNASKTPVVIDTNKPVAGTTTKTWTTDQIRALANLAAANYTQEADGSDKGQWRVPNQRELGLMMVYNNEVGLSAVQYACGTFFTAGTSSGKTRPFQINNTNTASPFITLADGNEFSIRPVRDVSVTITPNQGNNDSQYSNQGTGFGIK